MRIFNFVSFQRREESSATMVESFVLLRALVAQSLRDVDGLVTPISRTVSRILHQQRGHTERSGWRVPSLEHQIQENHTRRHISLSVTGDVDDFRQIPSQLDSRRYLLRSDRPLGQQSPEENANPTHASIGECPHGKHFCFLNVTILEISLAPRIRGSIGFLIIVLFLQHPVYCLNVVGTQNAHNLISISTDGKMCSWSLDMLSQPQETLDVQTKQSKSISVTCLAFPHGDVNNFVVGSEDGTVFSGTNY